MAPAELTGKAQFERIGPHVDEDLQTKVVSRGPDSIVLEASSKETSTVIEGMREADQELESPRKMGKGMRDTSAALVCPRFGDGVIGQFYLLKRGVGRWGRHDVRQR